MVFINTSFWGVLFELHNHNILESGCDSAYDNVTRIHMERSVLLVVNQA